MANEGKNKPSKPMGKSHQMKRNQSQTSVDFPSMAKEKVTKRTTSQGNMDNSPQRETNKTPRDKLKKLQSQSNLDQLASLKNIKDSSSTASQQSSKESEEQFTWRLDNLQSSAVFEKIMDDIDSKMVENYKRTYENNENETQSVQLEKPTIQLELDEEDEEELNELEAAKNNPLKIKARRAWALIRRYIREQSMNKTQNKSTFQWNMLQQTIKNITNMDAARENLYSKYLNPGNPRPWADGIKSIPPGFFSKHSRQIMRKQESAKSYNKRVKSGTTVKNSRHLSQYN